MKLKKSDKNFFDLSSREQKKIIRSAVKVANSEQKNLIKRYDKYRSEVCSCN